MEKRSIDEMQMQYNRDDDMPLEGKRGSMIIVEENLRPEKCFGNDENHETGENTRIIEHTIITQGEEVEAPNIDDNLPASLTPYLLLIEKMKIAALKTALKERGMGTRGKKMDLKNRLIHAVNEGTPVLTPVEATKIVESSRK